MVLKLSIVAVALLVLSGCASVGIAVDKAAEANDTGVDSAVWYLCHGASIGSIRREFGQKPGAWESLCSDSFYFED
jgi:uncharacterized protein YceK